MTLAPPRALRREDLPGEFQDLWEKFFGPVGEYQRSIHAALSGQLDLLQNVNIQVASFEVTAPDPWTVIPDSALQESWKGLGDYQPPAWMKDQLGRVHLRGAVHRGTPNHKRGTQLWGLPDALLPARPALLPLASSGLSCAARYTTASAGSYGNAGTGNALNFATKVYDTDDAVATSPWKFTVPTGKGGIYRVSAAILVASHLYTSAMQYSLYLAKNGTSTNEAVSLMGSVVTQAGATTTIGVNGSDDVSLAAGDYISIVFYQDSGSARALATSTLYNHVSVSRIHEDAQLKVGTSGKLEVFGGYQDRVHLDGVSWEAADPTPVSQELDIRLQKKIAGNVSGLIPCRAYELKNGTPSAQPLASPVWADFVEDGGDLVVKNITGLPPGRKCLVRALVIPEAT